MNITQLDKQIHKQYWDNDQRLYISSIEVMNYEGRSENGPLSIYSLNTKKEFDIYLFDVRNYNAFYEQVPTIRKSILYPDNFEYKEVWDSGLASSSMFWDVRQRIYTIPKFTNITQEDILRCFNHFRREVIGAYCLFNVSWHEFKDETTNV